jgi:serpin B
VTSADSSQLASDNAAFAFDVYKTLILTKNNLVFSPASISTALAMTYAGAAGTTASEMASTLHFSLPPAQLHPAFNALDQALHSRGDGHLGADGQPMQVNITNALWAEQTFTFRSDFLDTLAANYGAGVSLLVFINAPDPSRLTINAWVAAKTNNLIRNALPFGAIDAKTKLVLTNTVYFNAAWYVFDKNGATRDEAFTRLDGSDVTVKIMGTDSTVLSATRGSNFVAASLPYDNPDLSLVVVVPDTGKFVQVESSLNATTLTALVAGLTSQSVGLYLPRFTIETETGLAQTLGALGMVTAFREDGSANFSGMTDATDLFIKDVLHKAVIKVAERGTEAAAMTAVVVVGGTTGHPMPPLVIDATRPFLYFLRDQPTGTILFMGRVMDPGQN